MHTAEALLALVRADRDRMATLGWAAASALALHTALQRQPVTTATALGKATGLSAATVNKTLALLEGLGLVDELTERRRGRVFSYREYIGLINAGLEQEARPQGAAPVRHAQHARKLHAPRQPRSERRFRGGTLFPMRGCPPRRRATTPTNH